jgi:hypothetical protein
MKRSHRIILLLVGLLALLAGGCTPPTPTPGPPTPRMGTDALFAGTNFTQRENLGLLSAFSSVPQSPLGLRVELYQLKVPAGTISRNEKFWKHVDEQALDPARYELLLKNGVRAGIASVDEWSYFRDIIADHPDTVQASDLVAAESKPVEFTVRKDVPEQNIFYYDQANRLIGKTFPPSENLITISFQQAPRRPRTMRVVICPVVRSKFKRLEFTPMNREMEFNYVAPERLYDLNLQADIPAGDFLIVAPSSEATWPTSIGNNFFITEGPAEKLENVLLVVPRAIRIEPVARK